MAGNKLEVVMAVFPTRRGFGFACVQNGTLLLDYGVVVIRPSHNVKIIERFEKDLDYYQPTVVLLQDPDSIYSREGERVTDLIELIATAAKARRLPVFQYKREQIRDVFEVFGARSRHEIAQALVATFPELKHKMPPVRKLYMPESFNASIFDALSLAVTHQHLNG